MGRSEETLTHPHTAEARCALARLQQGGGKRRRPALPPVQRRHAVQQLGCVGSVARCQVFPRLRGARQEGGSEMSLSRAPAAGLLAAATQRRHVLHVAVGQHRREHCTA